MGDQQFEAAVERIRKETDILEVVGKYVTLKKSGKRYFGLCPFHSEKTPSFSVTPDRQIFYCFGCGQGGDVIKFVMEIEQFTFSEAVKFLADQNGISLPNQSISITSKQEDKELQSLYNAMEISAQLYHQLLLHSKHGRIAREYLAKRNIHEETIREFQIGYAPNIPRFLLDFLTTRQGYSIPTLLKAGLISQSERFSNRYFDRFRGRLMFPIHDAQGRVIAFGGRLLADGQPKYLNSPESKLFHKRYHLFNFHRARSVMRKQKEAVLFEGFLDAISAWQAGIHNVIATMGTSLSEDHAKWIRRNVESVLVCYDGDRAGQEAAEKAAKLLYESSCIVKVAHLPTGMDPDDYLKQNGADAFKENILAGAISYHSFQLERLKRKFSLQEETGRLQYLHQAVEMIAKIPFPIEQDYYLQKLSEEFGVHFDTLKDQSRRVKGKKQSNGQRDKEKEQWNNGYYVRRNKAQKLPNKTKVEKAEMFLIYYMLNDRQIAHRVEMELGADFSTDIYAALAAYLFSFYQRGNEADPVRFLHYIEESELSSAVSELLTRDFPESPSETELQDYIKCVKLAQLEKEIQMKVEQIHKLDRVDPLRALKLLQEVNLLRSKLTSPDNHNL